MNLDLRIHGRGGQGIKTAGRIVSTAAFLEGRHAEDSPMYGPERRGAPVVSFVRVSDGPVEVRGPITRPDAVVLADPSVIDSKAFPALGGLRKESVVIVNASPQRTVAGVPKGAVFFDATGNSKPFLKKGNLSTAVAATACKVLGIASLESLRQAVKMEMEEIGLDQDAVQSNLMAANACFSLAPKAHLPERLAEDQEVSLAEIVAPSNVLAGASVIMSTGNAALNRTGDWRTSRPVIDYVRCTKCMICYVYCPDSAVRLGPDLAPSIDYDSCKGCLICAEECPLKAISEAREGDIP